LTTLTIDENSELTLFPNPSNGIVKISGATEQIIKKNDPCFEITAQPK